MLPQSGITASTFTPCTESAQTPTCMRTGWHDILHPSRFRATPHLWPLLQEGSEGIEDSHAGAVSAFCQGSRGRLGQLEDCREQAQATYIPHSPGRVLAWKIAQLSQQDGCEVQAARMACSPRQAQPRKIMPLAWSHLLQQGPVSCYAGAQFQASCGGREDQQCQNAGLSPWTQRQHGTCNGQLRAQVLHILRSGAPTQEHQPQFLPNALLADLLSQRFSHL